jgi:hypothetical protein
MSYTDLFRLLEEDKYEEADEYILNNPKILIYYYDSFKFNPSPKIIKYLVIHKINPFEINRFFTDKIVDNNNLFKLVVEMGIAPENIFHRGKQLSNDTMDILMTHNFDFQNKHYSTIGHIFCSNYKYISILIETYNFDQKLLCNTFLNIIDVKALTVLADYIEFDKEYNDSIMEDMILYGLPETLTDKLLAKGYYFRNDQKESDLVRKIHKYDISINYLGNYITKNMDQIVS